MSAKLAAILVEHIDYALDCERHRCAEVARRAVLAEGRTMYEANRIWHAVIDRPLGWHRPMEAEDIGTPTGVEP